MSPLLAIRNLSVRFGGVRALSDIDLDVPESGIFGIIGPNGAGKTTLFNCITGFVRPSFGSSILFKGEEIGSLPIHKRARRGISRTFQNISLIGEQSVEENILAGFHLAWPYSVLQSLVPTPAVLRAEQAARKEILAVAGLLGIPDRYLGEPAGVLPLGLQKKVEVARALVGHPRLLLLDEPAGGLNDDETNELATALRRVAARPGITVVLVDHDMKLVMGLCDGLCVLNFGAKIATGSPAEIQRNEAVLAGYLGTAHGA